MKLPRLSLKRSWQLTKISAFTLAIGFAPALSNAQSSFTTVPVTVGVDNPPPMASAASESCTISNMQAGLAGGNLTISNTPGRGYSIYFDPAGTDELNDPGCFFSDPYPFTIDNVQLNMLAASGFGQTGGVGTLEYEVLIREADDDGAGCNIPGAILFESETLTVEIVEGSNFFPATIPVGIDVSEGFFAEVVAVSWSGPTAQAPSMVVWDNTVGTVPACRQYVILLDAETSEPFYQPFDLVFTAGGWTNMVVNGTTADIAGDVEITVSDVVADPVLTQSLPATVTATVSNTGTGEAAGVDVVLTANGTEIGTTSVNLAPGADTEVSFVYTPAVVGEVILLVTVEHPNDIDLTNNTASTTVTVDPPADPCIFSDDIEGYELGGLVDQTDLWVLWTPGNMAMDAEVSDEQANSGTKSVKIGATPDDVNFNLGNQTSGTWKIAFSVYIPEGNGAYWNIQKSETPGTEWAMQMFLFASGEGSIDAGGAGVATFDFDHDAWNDIEIIVNVDADVANLYFNGEYIYQWTYSWTALATDAGLSQIGSINFYPAAVATAPFTDTPLMYVDDVSFCMFMNNGPCEAFELQFGEAVQGDNTGATPYDDTIVPGEDCWFENGIDNDVWYSFNVPADGDYLVTTNLEELENDDTQILVFTSDDDTCEGVLTQIGCGDDTDDNFLTEVLLEELTAGTLIWIMVDGYNGTEGTFQIGVFDGTPPPPPTPPVNNECVDATDLSNLTGGAIGEAQNSDPFTSVDATNEEGLDAPSCWDEIAPEPLVQVSTWYSFTGDGNAYFIMTNDCDGGEIDYIPFGDSQMGIYTGDCNELVEVACGEDIDFAGENYAAGVEFSTEVGVEYTIMVDTWGGAEGEFCISFEQLAPDNTNNPDKYGMTLFPNPATDIVRIQADENMTNVIVLNSVGQMVQRVDANTSPDVVLNVNNLAKGLYFVQVTIAGEIFTKKFTVQ